jgi:hypothetical protein
VFPDAGCDTADVLRRFDGAIERTFGVAASPALGTLRISVGDRANSNGGFEIFLGGFWWREEHKVVHMLQATIAHTRAIQSFPPLC